jgi:hypothetical protein
MELSESLKILESITKTLKKGEEHYETQLGVNMIPGVDGALLIMAKNYKVDPAVLRMGVQMGVYLHIRYEENKMLESIFGDPK